MTISKEIGPFASKNLGYLYLNHASASAQQRV